PLELPANVVERDAADDRPAVRAEVRGLRPRELGDQAIHLLARERHVGLDRRPARDERERPVQGRLAHPRPAELVHGGLDEPPGLAALEQRRYRAHHDRRGAETLEREAQALERRAPALEQGAGDRRQLERLREQEALGGWGALAQLALQSLEQ